MDDINNNNPNNPDNFEFEDYPENDMPKEPSGQGGDEAFQEYEKQNEEFVPVTSGNNGTEHKSKEKDDTNPAVVPVPPLSAKDDAKMAQRRARKREQERRRKEEEERKRKSMTTTIVIFAAMLFVMWIVFFSLTNLMPGRLMEQGKKYLSVKDYPKAYNMFRKASKARPYDEEPVYYQTIALANLPPTYENQLALYEIAESDDFEEASARADAILLDMKKQADRKIGSNYADNTLFNDILFRWNPKEPITYTIKNLNGADLEYINSIKQAFKLWSTASNGDLVFKELINDDNADIVVDVNDALSPTIVDDISKSGFVTVDIQDDILKKAQIELKTKDFNGINYDINRFKNVAEHEIGHALGIWGHSANPKDIMYYFGDYVSEFTQDKGISQRDANTLNLLYKMVPDVTNKPIDEKDKHDMFYHYIITSYPGEDFELETQRLLSTLSRDRSSIVGWVDLGINYGIKKQYKRSNAIFNMLLPYTYNDFNNQFVVLYNMAANYYKMRDYNLSEKYLRSASAIHQDIDTQTLEAFLDFKMKRYDLAKGKLIILNEKYPDNIEVAVKLIRIYYINNETVKAQEVLDKLLRYNPDAATDKRVIRYRKYSTTTIKNRQKKNITLKQGN